MAGLSQAPTRNAGHELHVGIVAALELASVFHIADLLVVQVQTGKPEQVGRVAPGNCLPVRDELGKALERDRAVERVARDGRTPQRAEVRPTAEALPEVARNGADVGALAHMQQNVPVWELRDEAPVLSVVEVDRHGAAARKLRVEYLDVACLELERLALACRLVTPFFLIAEYAGGSCLALPTSDESVCWGSSPPSTARPSPGALEENCVTIRPSASSVSVATPKTIRAEYALSWPVR